MSQVDPRVSPEQLKEIYRRIEDLDPALWAKCYPRIYDDPKCGKYYSPRTIAYDLFGIAKKFDMGFVGDSERYEFLVASQLAKYNVPTFWIGQEMSEAIRQTVPPMKLDWYNMPMPFEAAAFMMPKGSLVHPDPNEGECSYIAYARFKEGEEHKSRLANHTYGSINGAMTIMCNTVKGQHVLHWNIPYFAYEKLDLAGLDQMVMRYEHEEHYSGWYYQPHMTHDDNVFMARVAHYIFGTLLLMNTRPSLITQGALKKRVKKQNSVREFWSPNVIGEHYRVRREYIPQGGTHASPRFHWVRGSIKQQPYGPKFSLRKELWIEPYMRGIDTKQIDD